MQSIHYFATCARGLEPILAKELELIQAKAIQPGRGGVAFSGGAELVYKANLWLRTAVRVLRPILDAPVDSPEALYEAVGGLDWFEYLTPDHTFAVDCNARDSAITHSHYAALKTKDAICDQFVARVGRRPSIDVQNPMVGLNLHIYRNQMTLSLDSSGESLHKRGYRPILTKAPLNEALAAALVQFTSWTGDTPFADPMCGSGTLPIEASWIALKRPPGLTRKRFGFHGWLDFDIRTWTEIRDTARDAVLKQLQIPIIGSDGRADAIMFSEQNARAAGVSHFSLEKKDLRLFRPPDGPPGVIVCNPPYGERIGETEELKGLYQLLANVLQEHCRGYSAFVFSGNEELEREIGMKPASRLPLYNGKIACHLLKYQL